MSDYTTQLRRVCEIYGRDEVENWFKSYKLEDSLTPEQIAAITKFNVWSKEKLAKMIVDHYYMREIGFETPALFKHYAMVTMNEIMPRYLLKIYTQFLEYDPLSSVDYVEEYTREIQGSAKGESTATGKSNSSSNSNSSSLSIDNNTPQGRITKQKLDDGAYASSVGQGDSESNINDKTATENNSSSTGESKTVEKYTHSMKGDNGVIVTNQYLVREFRELAISFNEEIINELNILFMGLF